MTPYGTRKRDMGGDCRCCPPKHKPRTRRRVARLAAIRAAKKRARRIGGTQ